MPQKQTETESIYNSVWEAKKEWDLAEARFQEATGKEIVDYAIYEAMAARKKYMYLMQRAKDMGL